MNDQLKSAMNCGIEVNASNENITKYKNLFGFKSILNSRTTEFFIQWFARCRNAALI